MNARRGVRPFLRMACLLAAIALSGNDLAAADVTFEKAPLTVVTTDGHKHVFTVELALDSAQRERGLMFRKTMAPDHGMLFAFGETRQVMMWMKNTDLPLDMLFLAKDGKVETVRANAVPQSEAIIDSGVPVDYVVELNAGTAKRLSIAPGARVSLPANLRNVKPD